MGKMRELTGGGSKKKTNENQVTFDYDDDFWASLAKLKKIFVDENKIFLVFDKKKQIMGSLFFLY